MTHDTNKYYIKVLNLFEVNRKCPEKISKRKTLIARSVMMLESQRASILATTSAQRQTVRARL